MAEATAEHRPHHLSLADSAGQGADRFAQFQFAMDGVFDLVSTAPAGSDVDAALSAWSTGRITISEAGTGSIRLIRSFDAIARSGLDLIAVRLVTSGDLVVVRDGVETAVGPGGIVFIDMLQPLELRATAADVMAGDVTLWAPRARLSSSLVDERTVHALAISAGCPSASLIGACLQSLAGQAGGMTVRELDSLAEGVVALITRVLPIELERRPKFRGDIDSRGDQALASLVSVRRFIDQNLPSQELNPEMIAGTFGLSRASLYRMFEPLDGVIAYVRKQRLHRAFLDIVTPGLSDRKIETIAHRWGFESAATFTRAFKAAYGVSPVKARIAARDGIAARPNEGAKAQLITLLGGRAAP